MNLDIPACLLSFWLLCGNAYSIQTSPCITHVQETYRTVCQSKALQTNAQHAFVHKLMTNRLRSKGKSIHLKRHLPVHVTSRYRSPLKLIQAGLITVASTSACTGSENLPLLDLSVIHVFKDSTPCHFSPAAFFWSICTQNTCRKIKNRINAAST